MQKKIKNNNIFYILLIISIMVLITIFLHYFLSYPSKKYTLETFDSDKKIAVVYFAFLKEDKWRVIVLPQMQDLVNCGLAQNADITIVLSGTEKEINDAKKEITDIIYPVNNKLNFIYSYENTYEYPGIKVLYEKANENPEKIFLYFHSKGMVFYDEPKRNSIELFLFDKLIKDWNKIINIFEKNPDKNKVSLGCSKEGFCWFNFFWVRGKYLKEKCSPPLISENRYYYESYIGTDCKDTSYTDCYNIADDNKVPYYDNSSIAGVVYNAGCEINVDGKVITPSKFANPSAGPSMARPVTGPVTSRSN